MLPKDWRTLAIRVDGFSTTSTVTSLAELFDLLAIDYTSPQSTGLVRWHAIANASGTTNLAITLTDGGLDGDLATTGDNVSMVKTVVIDVTAVNDLPTFELAAQVTVDEDSPLQSTDITAISAGPLETTQSLTLSATTNSPELFSTLGIQNIGATSATLSWLPAPNMFGSADVVVTVVDSGLDGDLSTVADNGLTKKTITIHVQSVNDAPHFDIVSFDAVQEDAGILSTLISSVLAGGNETQALLWSIQTVPANALITASVINSIGQTADLSLQTAANFFGDIQIAVSLTDAGTDNNIETAADNLTFVKTFVLTVNPVNDAPSSLSLLTSSVPENTPGFSLGAIQVTDVDDTTLSFTTSHPRFIVENGELKLAAAAQFNFETEPSVNL